MKWRFLENHAAEVQIPEIGLAGHHAGRSAARHVYAALRQARDGRGAGPRSSDPQNPGVPPGQIEPTTGERTWRTALPLRCARCNRAVPVIADQVLAAARADALTVVGTMDPRDMTAPRDERGGDCRMDLDVACRPLVGFVARIDRAQDRTRRPI